MGIRPLDTQSPISTVKWDGREGRAYCEENHNEGIGSRSLQRSTGVPYDSYFGLRKVTCTAVEQTFEIHSTFDTGLNTTGPHEPRGYSIALRREARETEARLPLTTETSNGGISVGDHVLLRKNTGGYQSAVVIKKADTPRSYNVRTKDSAVDRRTSRHLKKPRHYAGDVPRTAAPEALRYEIPSGP